MATSGAATTGLLGTDATAVAVEQNGTLWIGTRCNGLFRRQGGTWTYFDSYNAHLPDSGVHALLPAAGGTLWITSRRGYVYSYDPSSNLTSWGSSPLVYASGGARQPLVDDPNGGLWFAATSGGVAHLMETNVDRLDGGPWNEQPAAAAQVVALGKDGNGRLWATTAAGSPAHLDAARPGATWQAAPAAAAATTARIVSSSAQEAPMFASAEELFVGPVPLPPPAPLATHNIGFIREGEGDRWLCAYSNRPGVLLGSRSGAATLKLDEVRATDACSDHNKGWWIAAGSAGILHIDEAGGVIERTPMAPAPPAPWVERPLLALLEEPAQDVQIADVLANPFAVIGRRIRLRGRIVPQHPSVRFEDENGILQLIAASVKLDLLKFWTKAIKPLPNPPLPFWADSVAPMDFYGYLEIGGCTGEIEETTLSFYITEYYLASSPPSQRAAIKNALVDYLKAQGN